MRARGVLRRESGELGASLARIVLSDDLVERLGVTEGSFVEITNDKGRRALATVDRSQTTLAPESVIVDRLLRQSMHSYVGDRVVVGPVELDPATRVVIQTPFDISRSHGLREELKDLLVELGVPCTQGMRFYAAPHGSAGMVYEVGSVEPRDAYIDKLTSFEFVPVERGTGSGVDVGYEDIGGLGSEVAQLRELIELPLRMPAVYRRIGIRAPRGIILCGPPGVGKTYMARAVANELNARVFLINGPSVIGTVHGETEKNIRGIFDEAAHHAPALIVIDELDGIAPQRRDSDTRSDARAVTTLLSCMDGLNDVDGVAVIGTTNRIDDIDAALRRPGRFDKELIISPPDEEGRAEILRVHTREMPLTPEAVDFLGQAAALTVGYVGADIVELCREAGLEALRRRVGTLDLRTADHELFDASGLSVDREDFARALNTVRPSASRQALVENPDVDWDQLVGMDDLKASLDRHVVAPLRRAQASDDVLPRIFRTGILLSGPSGSGKTTLARGLAKRAGLSLCVVNGPELFGKWLGETEAAVREAFAIARRLAPTILLLDQLDAIAPVRGGSDGSYTASRVVNQLLVEIDDLHANGLIALMAATSRLDLIDPAMLNPGRFGVRLDVELPSDDSRREIASRLLRRRGLHDGDGLRELAEAIATRTPNGSAADVEALIENLEYELWISEEKKGSASSSAAAPSDGDVSSTDPALALWRQARSD